MPLLLIWQNETSSSIKPPKLVSDAATSWHPTSPKGFEQRLRTVMSEANREKG
jgi:hypothetical protein